MTPTVMLCNRYPAIQVCKNVQMGKAKPNGHGSFPPCPLFSAHKFHSNFHIALQSAKLRVKGGNTMYQKKLEKDIRCPLEYGLSAFGGKWKSRMPEDEKNVPFYEKHGFQRMEHGAAIQICNYSDKR